MKKLNGAAARQWSHSCWSHSVFLLAFPSRKRWINGETVCLMMFNIHRIYYISNTPWKSIRVSIIGGIEVELGYFCGCFLFTFPFPAHLLFPPWYFPWCFRMVFSFFFILDDFFFCICISDISCFQWQWSDCFLVMKFLLVFGLLACPNHFFKPLLSLSISTLA